MNYKYIKTFEDFKKIKEVNEELNLRDVFSNLFKSKKTKQFESSVREWTALNQKFNDIFSKNKKWQDYLSKFGYIQGVTETLYQFWGNFSNADEIYYPFKVSGKNYKELTDDEIGLLKSMIEQSIKMKTDFKGSVDKIQKSSNLLFDNWKKLSDEFDKDLQKAESIGDSREINNRIIARIDNIESILKGLTEGYIPYVKDEDSLKLIDKIFLKKSSHKDFIQENGKINYLKMFLSITENFDKQITIEKIKNQVVTIEKFKKIKQKINELNLIQLISDTKFNPEINIAGVKYRTLNICKDLNISPNKFSNDKELFQKIDKTCTALHYSKLQYDKEINKLFELCDKVLNKDKFFDKLTTTTTEIIDENNLTDSDVYFTHSSSIKNLDLNTIKFDYDEEIRGKRSENTPKDIYGLYITNWKSNEEQEYDAWHYIYRATQASGIFNPRGINLYIVDLKEDAKFLKSSWAQFRQTNESTKEFADYCISLGLSGYYHPNVYGEKSALEIVIIDKKAIKDFKRNDDAKEKIISVEYNSKK